MDQAEDQDAAWTALERTDAPDHLAALPRRGGLFWAVTAVGLAVLAVATVVTTVIAAFTIVAMRHHDDCPLPVYEFEVVGSDTVDVSWFHRRFGATTPW